MTERRGTMRLEVWRDGDAWARLQAPAFREQWERLHAECPWASVFQSYGYASAWYDVYRPRFAPLIVGGVGDDGTLAGLLPLAVDNDGQPVAAGAWQAEYQGWIARAAVGDAFIEAALERLASECPGRTLTLRYLPRNAPRAWLRSRRGVTARCMLLPTRHGIMELSEASTEAALRKKENRHRLRVMERSGPVVYQRVTDPREVDALLDEIIPLCDFRHGALHGVMPFADDPLKAPFHRALARVPGVLHVSVLRCGGEVACAAVDADNGSEVALGFAAFSPFLSRQSPRRVQLAAMAHDLSLRGYSAIDLTPGDDDYKRGWATRFDEAYTLHVFFSRSRFVARTTVDAAHRTASVVLRGAGADPARLRQHLGAVTNALTATELRRLPALAARALRRRLWSDDKVDFYRFESDAVDTLPLASPMRRDRVGDLLAYRPGLFASEVKRVFLRVALGRLGHDAHVFTLVEGGRLVACAWVWGPPGTVDPTEWGSALRRGSDSALVYDLMASPPVAPSGGLAPLLAQLVREAAGLPGVGHVLVAAPSRQPEVRQAALQLGGRYAGSIRWRRRVGRTEVTSTFGADERSAPSREGQELAAGPEHRPAAGGRVEVGG